MRKWLTRGAVAAALIMIVLLAVVHQMHPPGIWMGKLLPPGKVQPQLVNAGDVAALLAPDGSLWASGGTEFGHMAPFSLLGVFSQPTCSQIPRRVGVDSDWFQVAVSPHHTLALKKDGSLWAWGFNQFGQVGQISSTSYIGTPTRIGTDTDWTQICAGAYHSLALKRDGSLWEWGLKRDPLMGLNRPPLMGSGRGESVLKSIPTMVGTERDWQTIAADSANSFAIKSNGTIWGWGRMNDYGDDSSPRQIAPGTNWLALSAYDSTLVALNSNGTIWVASPNTHLLSSAFGFRSENLVQVGRDSDWAGIYAGSDSFLAHKENGTWWGCGANWGGQLGLATNVGVVPVPQRLPFGFEPWALACGERTSLLLAHDGKLWTWGLRLGFVKPSLKEQKIQAFLAPLVKRFPSLGFLAISYTDETPYPLWELPPEVRRALGTAQNGVTNNLTAAHPANASHE